MAMHLIDRPHLEIEQPGYRAMSAVGSAALHAAIALTLVALMRMSSDEHVTAPMRALLPDHLIWIPSVAVGGGRDGGGERAIEPPRRARAVGAETISVPAAPHTSTDSTIEPPEETSTLPAKPMGDAMQTLVGSVNGNGTSAGPGDGGAGDADKPGNGALGTRDGDGVGQGVTRGGPGVTMPTLIERVSPKYTADAMRARIQGSVWIECVVMPDGSVGDARVMRSLDRRFGLDEEAISAAKRWRFRPGRIDGKPVPVIVSIELMFSVR